MKIYDFNSAPGKPLVTLLYANGFLPQTYERALRPLFDDYHVVCIQARPMWDPVPPLDSIQTWSQFGDDLLEGIDSLTDQPVIGIGHSFGGIATLYAAIKHPDRFRRLVLIDPTLLPLRVLRNIAEMRQLGRADELPLSQGAVRRRRTWESTEAAYQSFRTKSAFTRFPDDVLHAYAESMTMPDPNGGVRITYSPEWEAHIYETIDTETWELPAQVTLPMLVLRGELTDTFSETSAKRFHELNPRARMVTVMGAGHLVPQEQPDETGRLIAEYLREPA